ncbi:unnamed protein product, partial [Polarella glacialis]
SASRPSDASPLATGRQYYSCSGRPSEASPLTTGRQSAQSCSSLPASSCSRPSNNNSNNNNSNSDASPVTVRHYDSFASRPSDASPPATGRQYYSCGGGPSEASLLTTGHQSAQSCSSRASVFSALGESPPSELQEEGSCAAEEELQPDRQSSDE